MAHLQSIAKSPSYFLVLWHQLQRLRHGDLIAIYGERLFDPIEVREITSDGYTLTAAIDTGGALTDHRALSELIVIGAIVRTARLTDVGREWIERAARTPIIGGYLYRYSSGV